MNFGTIHFAYIASGSWLQFLLVGVIVGLLLDLCMKGKSYGFLGNSLLGFGGAILGTFIWEKLLAKHIKIDIGYATIHFNMVLAALLGAVLLLMIIKLIERGKQS